MSSPSSVIVPESASLQADERVDQLGLAVALDAGDAQDLALVDGEGDVVEHRADDAVGVDGAQAQVRRR